jgi:hypothetical protein
MFKVCRTSVIEWTFILSYVFGETIPTSTHLLEISAKTYASITIKDDRPSHTKYLSSSVQK